jgi:uncharacterized membrane protein YhaH (DUF805 family)
MMRTVTVARIHDIDIRLHPTFALVFLWVLIDWRRIGAGVGISSVVFTLILVILIFACVLQRPGQRPTSLSSSLSLQSCFSSA